MKNDKIAKALLLLISAGIIIYLTKPASNENAEKVSSQVTKTQQTKK